MSPDDRKYARTHEWVKLEGDLAVVGISDHAQAAMGDVTFVERPIVGSRVAPGEACGVIESVKAAGDLYAPLAGEVAETNDALETAPEAVNADPYGEGWIFKLRGVDRAGLDALLDAAAYDAEAGADA